jgi:hypothetical protein
MLIMRWKKSAMLAIGGGVRKVGLEARIQSAIRQPAAKDQEH